MEIALILALPLLSAFFCGVFNKNISFVFANILSSLALLASCILSFKALFLIHINKIILHEVLFTWFRILGEKVNWAIYLDALSATMFVVVTVVSTIVHIYSYGYMKNDGNGARFMSYLSLFTFFMLLLVSADNFIQLFVGWEGVGLCSYLLIGFWYKKDSASNAAIKAFVVNRVGDFAFILGILAIIFFTGTLKFESVFSSLSLLSDSKIYLLGFDFRLAEVVAFLLFIGCMGKSAQIGLHVWLPDAMEGPTPVSALIHAATMVTAGVFLVARSAPIFELAPYTTNIILYVGAITCLFAASIAIAQDDIKKIIAYSTCSQLGYMFMAAGALSFKASIFHLVTHAFFKAMLFLSAGIVIHAVHEQDINKMGGLRKYMPVTYLFFIIGSLAIMGIYPFAGYYSKDLILESVYESGNLYAFYMGIIAAFFTSIYSMKIIIKVFHGKPPKKKVKEWESSMILPLLILAFASIVSGFYLINYFVGFSHPHVPLYIKYMPMGVGIFGILLSFLIYQTSFGKKLYKPFSMIYTLFREKYYIDEIYDKSFVKGTYVLANMSRMFDRFIDFFPNASAAISRNFAGFISQVQSGYIFTYVFYILLGVWGIMLIWILKFYF